MNPEKLAELAERCEREQPSYGLNDAICKATAGPNGNYIYRDYVNSLDAAMSLVPEGWQFGVGSQDSTRQAWAWVGKGGPLDEPYEEMVPANAATPALALAAASLRSLASRGGE